MGFSMGDRNGILVDASTSTTDPVMAAGFLMKRWFLDHVLLMERPAIRKILGKKSVKISTLIFPDFTAWPILTFSTGNLEFPHGYENSTS